MFSKDNTIRRINGMAGPLTAALAATLFAVPALAATTYTSVSTGGDWQTNATWGATSTSYPGENEIGDTANISSGSPVTLGGTISNDLGYINIAAGGTLELNSKASLSTSATLEVGNSNTSSGVANLDIASGTFNFYTLNDGGTSEGLATQSGGNITIGGGGFYGGDNHTNNSAYTITGGTLTVTGYYKTGNSGTFSLNVGGGLAAALSLCKKPLI